jgi:hypothetical protein
MQLQFVTTETTAIQRAVSAVIRHRNFDQNTYNHDIVSNYIYAVIRLYIYKKYVVFFKANCRLQFALIRLD